MLFLFAFIEQVVPFLPLAYAVSISFNVLQVTDLALDASFVAGAGCYAKILLLGFHPLIAFICALLAGGGAGILTALIQYKNKINSLLASILSSFILYSLILIIMDRPTISVLNLNGIFAFNIFNNLIEHKELVISMVYVVFALIISYICIAYCRIGLLFNALGSNPSLLKQWGYNIEIIRCCGFIITNMLSALSGVLTCASIGYADINMGIGLTLIGIGTTIIGQSILYKICKIYNLRFLAQLLACILGCSLYFIALNSLLHYEVNPIYIKMMVGLILIVFIYLSHSLQGLKK